MTEIKLFRTFGSDVTLLHGTNVALEKELQTLMELNLETFLGVRFIERTIHPSVVGPSAATAEGDFGMSARMLQAMMFSFFTFTFVFVTLLMHRMRLERLSDRVNTIKARLMA